MTPAPPLTIEQRLAELEDALRALLEQALTGQQRVAAREAEIEQHAIWLRRAIYLSIATYEVLLTRQHITEADVRAEMEAMRAREVGHATMMSDLERDLMDDWLRKRGGDGPRDEQGGEAPPDVTGGG
jgi:hypothetical protein